MITWITEKSTSCAKLNWVQMKSSKEPYSLKIATGMTEQSTSHADIDWLPTILKRATQHGWSWANDNWDHWEIHIMCKASLTANEILQRATQLEKSNWDHWEMRIMCWHWLNTNKVLQRVTQLGSRWVRYQQSCHLARAALLGNLAQHRMKQVRKWWNYIAR